MGERETTTRREVMRQVFVAPVILTFAAVPAFASAGSSASSHALPAWANEHAQEHARPARD